MNHNISNLATPHFSTGQNLWKKYGEKITIDIINWKKLFPPEKVYWKKYWEKINIDTINEKWFLIDPLNTNNAKYRDSLASNGCTY